MPTAYASQRLASVDALRGLTVAAMLLVNNPGSWSHVYGPLKHADWHGFTPTDLVFPMFLFIVGVGIALARTPPKPLARMVKLIALGLFLATLAFFLLDRPAFRPMGVLQRIGLCFGAAAFIALRTSPRGQWLAIAGVLAAYGALLAAGGTLAIYDNIASRVDNVILGRHNYLIDAATGRGHDPEGLLSTIPAIATTLLGVRAGAWLREGRLDAIVVGALAALALGLLVHFVQPMNKNLWTPAYALFSAGLSALALAAAHVAIDRRGWPAIGQRFGIHAIAAYVAAGVVNYIVIGLGWKTRIYTSVFAPLGGALGPEAASLAYAVAFVSLFWLLVWGLDRSGRRFNV